MVSEDERTQCSITKDTPDWNHLFNGDTCKYDLTPKTCAYIRNDINIGCPMYYQIAICPNQGNMHESCIWKDKGINPIDEI